MEYRYIENIIVQTVAIASVSMCAQKVQEILNLEANIFCIQNNGSILEMMIYFTEWFQISVENVEIVKKLYFQ